MATAIAVDESPCTDANVSHQMGSLDCVRVVNSCIFTERVRCTFLKLFLAKYLSQKKIQTHTTKMGSQNGRGTQQRQNHTGETRAVRLRPRSNGDAFYVNHWHRRTASHPLESRSTIKQYLHPVQWRRRLQWMNRHVPMEMCHAIWRRWILCVL